MAETRFQRGVRRTAEYFGLDGVLYASERREAIESSAREIESLKLEVAQLREELARVARQLENDRSR